MRVSRGGKTLKGELEGGREGGRDRGREGVIEGGAKILR